MLSAIIPKLPMRNKGVTKDYYINSLGFQVFGSVDFDGYLMLQREGVEVHFFEYKDLDPLTNYGQVYIRTNDIYRLYEELLQRKTPIHPNGQVAIKSWGQIEFSILDPDHNLITFGQSI